jgi:uncharacterized protein (TIGR00369 family)
VLELEQPPTRIHEHSDRVEAQRSRARALLARVRQPRPREAPDPDPLALPQPRQRQVLSVLATRACSSRLDLGEHDRLAIEGDHVDLPAPSADVAREHPEPEPLKVRGGELLSDPPEPVTRVHRAEATHGLGWPRLAAPRPYLIACGPMSEHQLSPGEPVIPPGPPDGPRTLDALTGFIGMRWDDPNTVRATIRPELINRGGMLSGVVGFALVDYCMGSTLWAETSEQERIATISISINYLQTATEGEIVCRSVLDRRNKTVGAMRSEVFAADGRLLATAIGTYSIFPARNKPRPESP